MAEKDKKSYKRAKKEQDAIILKFYRVLSLLAA
jgi:hypothetical protein